MIRRVLARALDVADRWLHDPREIPERSGPAVYIRRWYLWPWFVPSDEQERPPSRSVNGLLHCIHRADDDIALHSHPWSWAFAVVLRGGYVEERLIGRRIVARTLRPGSVAFLRYDDYHRIAEILNGESWSLFVHGRRIGSWNFLDRWTMRVCDQADYLDAKARGDVPPWRHGA